MTTSWPSFEHSCGTTNKSCVGEQLTPSGAHANHENAEALLVEEATANPEIGRAIVGRIVELIPRMIQQPLTLHELSRAVLLRDPDYWSAIVAPILDNLTASLSSVQEQDRWRRLAYEVERRASAEQAA